MKVTSNTRNPNLKRLNEIIKVLRKNGLEHINEHAKLSHKNPFKKKSSEEEELEANTNLLAIRVRKSFQELGPTFIKLGQTLSTRPDLVGYEMADELSKFLLRVFLILFLFVFLFHQLVWQGYYLVIYLVHPPFHILLNLDVYLMFGLIL